MWNAYMKLLKEERVDTREAWFEIKVFDLSTEVDMFQFLEVSYNKR